MVNLYKLGSGRARASNYEQILRIFNDTLGSAEGIGFVMAGTPDFLLDPRKGLYSYPALQGRLAENPYAKGGLVDYSGPVIRLANLTQEDLYLLLQKMPRRRRLAAIPAQASPTRRVARLHAALLGADRRRLLPHAATSVKAFVSMLAVLDQNPDAAWADLVPALPIEEERNPDLEPLDDEDAAAGDDDELASFKL